MLYRIRGKGKVHTACYWHATLAIDSTWRGTIIDGILLTGMGKCAICNRTLARNRNRRY
jgi:hypothetical protein